MAFPTIGAQQEINNRKILEDLQLKKQLLQKGVSPVAATLPNLTSNAINASAPQKLSSLFYGNRHIGEFLVIFGLEIQTVLLSFQNTQITNLRTPFTDIRKETLRHLQTKFVQTNQSISLSPDLPANSPARTAWNQANTQSFGFFVPQDSVFGNSILPVLPRFESITK